jgi:hypothetical protein
VRDDHAVRVLAGLSVLRAERLYASLHRRTAPELRAQLRRGTDEAKAAQSSSAAVWLRVDGRGSVTSPDMMRFVGLPARGGSLHQGVKEVDARVSAKSLWPLTIQAGSLRRRDYTRAYRRTGPRLQPRCEARGDVGGAVTTTSTPAHARFAVRRALLPSAPFGFAELVEVERLIRRPARWRRRERLVSRGGRRLRCLSGCAVLGFLPLVVGHLPLPSLVSGSVGNEG